MSATAAAARELPAPVRNYFAHALPKPSRVIRVLRMSQRGTLRTGTGSGRWLQFTAHHRAQPATRSFSWNALIRLLPFLTLKVRDNYEGGIGEGRVAIAGIPLGSDRDRPELNAASLHRYLAEAAWYPTALLPSAGVEWSAIDERCAQATLRDHGSSVDLEFRFGGDGQIASVYAPGRWQRAGRDYQLAPWEGRFADYRRCQGLLVPTNAEVGWHVGGRLEIVWRARIESLDYEFEADPGQPS